MAKEKTIKDQIKLWYAHQIWDSHTRYLMAKGWRTEDIHEEKDRVLKKFLQIDSVSSEDKLQLFEVYSLPRWHSTNDYQDAEDFLALKFSGLDLPEPLQDYMHRCMEHVLAFQNLSTLDPTNRGRLHRPEGIPIFANSNQGDGYGFDY